MATNHPTRIHFRSNSFRLSFSLFILNENWETQYPEIEYRRLPGIEPSNLYAATRFFVRP